MAKSKDEQEHDEKSRAEHEADEAKARAVSSSPAVGPTHYEVAHAAVGDHYKGQRVPAEQYTEEQRARLLEAGAILPDYEWNSVTGGE